MFLYLIILWICLSMQFTINCTIVIIVTDRIRNEEIRERAEVDIDIADTIETKRLRWYDHMRRISNEIRPQRLWEWQPAARRKRGRPPMSWNVCIQKTMEDRGRQKED